ncbi:1591_t:CDS:2 [Racocetra persica]|uniref:1591_t:CDS:1 n=1 Tax=Racocetra persica TaxID=160502 RepID=A0ACA9L1T5_9GLOM|nr:1591_t:CDS:2 [Racocetra persica]
MTFTDSISKVNKDHYMPFCKIYDKDISEKYCSSLLQKVNASTSSSSIAINGLSTNEKKNLLKNFIETIDYTCDTMFYGISDLTKISSPILNDNQTIDIITTANSDNNQAVNIVTNIESNNDTIV